MRETKLYLLCKSECLLPYASCSAASSAAASSTGAGAASASTSAAAQLRPAWRWEGYGGGWAYELQAAGRLRFDGAGRPLAELAPASPKANSASMAARSAT